jgi:hypothetical protein
MNGARIAAGRADSARTYTLMAFSDLDVSSRILVSPGLTERPSAII